VRERLLTLGLALLALLLFATLFVRGGGAASIAAARPTSAERGEDGLLGAMTWLREQGVHTLSLQERFGVLARRPGLPAAGNLLIVTLPAVTSFRNDEAVALDQWLRRGNTLLLLAALEDRPSWAREREVLDKDLQLLTGVEIELPGTRARPAAPVSQSPKPAPPAPAARERQSPAELISEATQVLLTPQRDTLVANRPHPYLENVTAAYGFSDYRPRSWSVRLPRDGFLLELAHRADDHRGVLWVLPDGAGSTIISGFGSLLSNRALGTGDNARLLANIVATSVGPGGFVLFDDQHQGLSATYDADKFYRDPRLYATLGIIGAVWLVWVLGGTRLHMPLRRMAAPREEELLRTSGLFLARVLRPAAAARRLFEQFFLRLPRPAGVGAGATAWEWLENDPRVARSDVAQLRSWYVSACAEQRVPLTELHNLILRTERQLAA
jgi:hypothetical protein